MRCMVKCTPIKSCNYFVGPPFIISLPCDHLHPSCSGQFAYKKIWLVSNGNKITYHIFIILKPQGHLSMYDKIHVMRCYLRDHTHTTPPLATSWHSMSAVRLMDIKWVQYSTIVAIHVTFLLTQVVGTCSYTSCGDPLRRVKTSGGDLHTPFPPIILHNNPKA